MKDVAVRVFEPRGLEIAGKMDVAFTTEAGQVVMLESDVRSLQGPNDRLDFVTDAPGRRRRFVGAGKLRLVDHDGGISAAVSDHAWAFRPGLFEAERAS